MSDRLPAGRTPLTFLVSALVALALVEAGPANAAGPKTGTYRATTNQCGTALLPHPCYTFTFKLAKGRCVDGHHYAHGLCLAVHHEVSGTMVKVDVSCPDGRTFPSEIIGPEVSPLLSPSGSIKFKAKGGATEAGREVIFDVETLAITVKGSKATGTLSVLTEEELGTIAPPQCTSGPVTFTAKRI